MTTRRTLRRHGVLAGALLGLMSARDSAIQGADFDPLTIGRWPGGWPADGDAIRWMGSVVVSGSFAYVASGPSGLQILDVSDPAQPRLVSRYGYSSGPVLQPGGCKVAVSGEHAYLAGAGLEVINIRDPHHPTRVGATDSGGGGCWAFAISDTHAYMAGYPGEGGVSVFAISNPKEPHWVATIPVSAVALAVAGTHLYAATWEGFEVWNVASPGQPHRVSTMPLIGRARSLALAGNHAVVACESTERNGQFVGNGLEIIDITDPGNLHTAGSYPTDAPVAAVAVAGHRALVVVGSSLEVIALSDPARPQRLGTYDNGLHPYSVAMDGDTGYLASGPVGFSGIPVFIRLELIDLSDPSRPRRQSAFAARPGGVDVAISGQFALVADGLAGLRVFDFSEPARPVSRAWIASGVNSCAVEVSESLACVAFRGSFNGREDGGGGLSLIGIKDPTHPSPLGRYETEATPTDVAVLGDHAYLVGDQGLEVINVSDPTRPRQVATVDSAVGPALAARNDLLFVASGEVISVKNPANPVQVARFDGDESIVVSDRYLCVGGPDGFQVLDVSEPNNPRRVGGRRGGLNRVLSLSGHVVCVGSYDGIEWVDISNPATPRRLGLAVCPGYEVSAAASGGYVVAVTPHHGLFFFDIARPANPQRVGGNPAILSAADIEVSGTYAYLASWDNGLQVINIADAREPKPAGRVITAGVTRGLTIAGGYAYLADGPSGLQVVDISNPAEPRLAGRTPTGGDALDVAVSGSRAFMACGDQGLQELDISDPLHPRLTGRYGADVRRLAVSGQRAYAIVILPDAGQQVEVINIAQPGKPSRAAGPFYVDSLGFPTSVPVGYSEDPDERWLLTDLTDPANLKAIGGYRGLAAALGIVLSSHYAFRIGNNWEEQRLETQVFDLADRTRPRLVGRNSSTLDPSRLALADGKLLVAASNYQNSGEGLVVLEMLPFIRSISHQAGHLQLDWEGWGRARLEGAASLTNPDWRDLGIPETASRASLPLTDPYGFFRLRTP